MIQQTTWMTVADNTGAKVANCVLVLGGTRRRYAHVGDLIIVSIKEAEPRGTVKRRSVELAVVVRTKTAIRRKDGSAIRFDDNACVIITKGDLQPKGTRVFGPVARELRAKGFQKIISQAPEVL